MDNAENAAVLIGPGSAELIRGDLQRYNPLEVALAPMWSGRSATSCLDFSLWHRREPQRRRSMAPTPCRSIQTVLVTNYPRKLPSIPETSQLHNDSKALKQEVTRCLPSISFRRAVGLCIALSMRLVVGSSPM
jgi:hypothetical protein